METRKKKIVIAQLGSRMHYAVPNICERSEHETVLLTDIWLDPNKKILSALNRFLFNGKLDSRFDSGLSQVISFDLLGVLYAVLRRSSIPEQLVFHWMMRIFNILVLRRTKNVEFGILYGFNGASTLLFEFYSRQHKIYKLLEQTMAPRRVERKLLTDEYRINEDIIDPKRFIDMSKPGLQEKDEAKEWLSCDMILAPSVFVRNSLVECGIDSKKIKIIPYGVERKTETKLNVRKDQQITKIVFIGEFGVRKGGHLLLEAWKFLPNHIKLNIYGKTIFKDDVIKKLPDNVTFHGFVSKSKVQEALLDADFLILPSFCEGSATVIYEAIMSGVPVLCSENSGPPTKYGIRLISPLTAENICEVINNYESPSEYERLMTEIPRGQEFCDLNRYQNDINNLFSSLYR